MPRSNQIDIYLEVGKTRTFAVAIDWPGWARSGRDEASALQALFDYAPRYAKAIRSAKVGFQLPASKSAFNVVERLKGNVTTDFGVPGLPTSQDAKPVTTANLKRWESILDAIWRTFDSTAASAKGKTLTKGPRGGGRELAKIIEHVQGGNDSYLTSLGGKLPPGKKDLADIRKALLTTLAASVRGEIPARGPHGGVRWTPRYFVRRLAWHDLDHAWEIEDRARG